MIYKNVSSPISDPSSTDFKRALRILAPLRKLLSPVVLGLEHIPNHRPLLFVGNHTLYGVIDVPFFVAELYEKKHIVLHSLADHNHFSLPVWGELLQRFGAVDGTRENCAALMESGKSILVFPGGAREVTKRKGEHYKLLWKERLGFARMAIRHGCTIVPFAAVGVEDSLEIVADANDILSTPFGKLLQTIGVKEDYIPPIAKGVGPTPLPKLDRLYFYIAPPIETNIYRRVDSDENAKDLRNQTREAIEIGIRLLQQEQAKDPKRKPLPRWIASLRK